jgi:ADP-ribose pyrophosphatase
MKTEILAKEKKYQAHVFDVSLLSVKLPDGKIRNYDLVEHVPAVTIVPVTDDGDILFVRQYRMGAEQELLELPAGILNGQDGNEDPLIGALRECREETGYEAKSMRRIGGIFMTPGYCTEYIHIYLAQDLVWNPLPQDEDEFLKTEKIPIETAYRMAESGEMNDAKSIAALMFAQPEIRKNKKI